MTMGASWTRLLVYSHTRVPLGHVAAGGMGPVGMLLPISSLHRGESSRMTPEHSNFICCKVKLKVNCIKLILIPIKPFISSCTSALRQTQSLLQLLPCE